MLSCSDGIPITKWYFEESNTWMEVVGAVAMWKFASRIHPGIIKMWGHLRKYAIYFLHYRPGQHTERQIRAAQQELFEYAVYAETHLGGKLLTVLLHRAVVHIPEQVLNGLPGASMREEWGEGCVRRVKRPVKGHAMAKIAQASANVVCDDMGLRLLRTTDPSIELPKAAPSSSSSSVLQDRVDHYGVQLHALQDAYTGECDEVSTFLAHAAVWEHSA